MKHYIVLDKVDISKINNDDEVKVEINGETIYICSERCFREDKDG